MRKKREGVEESPVTVADKVSRAILGYCLVLLAVAWLGVVMILIGLFWYVVF